MAPRKRPTTPKKPPSSSKRPKAPKRPESNDASHADVRAVVGVGASAGGLRALERLFDAMPSDSGMVFIVVQHLDPTRRSQIPTLLGRHTGMTITMAEDGMPIQPDHVYTIPPNRYLAVADGHLALTVPESDRGPKFSIDSLFDSLGRIYGDKAAGVVLSGTGTDGTQGLRAIKAHGGLAVAQDPATAEFDAMPRSAIDSGAVDTVVPVEKVPEVLVRYFSAGIRPPVHREPEKPASYVTELLALLRSRRRVDFKAYKPGTLHRRIERRMALLRCRSGEEYLGAVKRDPEELNRLFADLLIQVTHFFREPETWTYLRNEVIPGLVADADPEYPIRAWVPGCSTVRRPTAWRSCSSKQSATRRRTFRSRSLRPTSTSGRWASRGPAAIRPRPCKQTCHPNDWSGSSRPPTAGTS
jgi:two-component system, chemotaxis family, CheB/CheR fusion protein